MKNGSRNWDRILYGVPGLNQGLFFYEVTKSKKNCSAYQSAVTDQTNQPFFQPEYLHTLSK